MAEVKDKSSKESIDYGEIKRGVRRLPETREPSYSTSSGSSFFSTNVSITLLLLLAIMNDFYDWYSGFQINPIIAGIDVFTFIIFAISGAFAGKWLLGAIAAVLLELAIPGYLATLSISPAIVGTILIIPWWTVLSLAAKFGEGLESKFATSVAVAGVIVGLFLLNPFFLTNFTTDVGINQQWVYDTTDAVSTRFAEAYTAITQYSQVQKCTFTGGTNADCQSKVYGNEDALLKGLDIDASLNTGFTFNIAQFIADGSILSFNEVPTQIMAQNGLGKPVSTSFSCGLQGRGPGTIESKLTELQDGTLSLQDSTVICSNLDTSKRGTTTFYFNMTAKDVTASGYRDMITISSGAKEAVLSRYPGISENRVLEKSKEFGSYLLSKKESLSARVGKDDLAQPVIKYGSVVSVTDEFPLLFGIDQSSKINMAVFIKNNGKGKIDSIKDVTFKLPPGFELDEDKCGLTAEKLREVSWKSIASGKVQPVAVCGLTVRSPTLPNSPTPQTVSISVTYDYTVSKGVSVSIPERVTA
ncbi:MAG TPA: hypothetical protein VKE88_03090 [Candidatus Nanoarchaeia archaeon]|nr:hypothetical protein [Candidatus Nanoarchaeia archaeon]